MKVKGLIFLLLALVLSVAVVAAEEDTEQPTRIGTSAAALANVFKTEEGISVWRYVPELEQGVFNFYLSNDVIEDIRDQIEDGTLVVEEDILLGQLDDISLWYQADDTCRIDSPMVDGYSYSYSFEC